MTTDRRRRSSDHPAPAAPAAARPRWQAPRPPADWRLDEDTRRIGRQGVAAARALLGEPPGATDEDRRRDDRQERGTGSERPVARRLSADGTTVRWMPTVAERLDYPSDAKLLILNCADLGLCHAATVGVYEALRRHRHQRLAHRPGTLGTGVGVSVPGRRRRACDSPSTPSTTSTGGGRSPRPHRSSTATGAFPGPSPTSGITPTSTRSAGSAGPRSSGPSCGASTSAISTPISTPCFCGRSSSTSTSSWR